MSFDKFTTGYITRVRESYIELYNKNDEGHGITHADDVLKEALHILEVTGFNIPLELVILTAYAHDAYCWEGRGNHHITGAKHVLGGTNEYIAKLTPNDRFKIAKAVEEHRASYKGKFTTILSKVISSADRGKPDINKTIKRSFDYHKDNLDKESAILEVKKHLLDKFSSTGYASYPDIYKTVYAEELSIFRKTVDKIDTKYIREIINKE